MTPHNKSKRTVPYKVAYIQISACCK